MKACILTLQEQVQRLEAGLGKRDLEYEEPLRNGVPREILEQACSVGDNTDTGNLTNDEGRKSTVKSVTFTHSDLEDSDSDSENDDNGLSNPARSPSVARSRRSRASSHNSRKTSIAEMSDHDLLDQHLSEDTFGFLLATPTCSTPFGIGVGVLLFQVAIYTLMWANLLNS